MLEFLVHFLLAITGAIGVALAWLAGFTLLCAGGAAGCGWLYMGRRKRARERRRKKPD